MKEIGGYIEFEHYNGLEFYPDAVALNCARNCLAFLIEAREIKKIYIPLMLCSSVREACEKYSVKIGFYPINDDFSPQIDFLIKDNEYLYLVNYYGQLSNDIFSEFKSKYRNVIIDNVQAFFQRPIDGIDTIYTCRKFFGVPDGAYLVTDSKLNRTLPVDISYPRMIFLLARYETNAEDHYQESVDNNKLFKTEPIKSMSKLTHNLLRAIDYESIKDKRTANYIYLQSHLGTINKLSLTIPEGPFAYPLLIDNGSEIRKQLQKRKIYIPTLWPEIIDECQPDSLEVDYVKNILPIPCDQRYTEIDLAIMVDAIKFLIAKEPRSK